MESAWVVVMKGKDSLSKSVPEFFLTEEDALEALQKHPDSQYREVRQITVSWPSEEVDNSISVSRSFVVLLGGHSVDSRVHLTKESADSVKTEYLKAASNWSGGLKPIEDKDVQVEYLSDYLIELSDRGSYE